MIDENSKIEVITDGLKMTVEISELIEIIYQAVYEEMNRKTQEPKR